MRELTDEEFADLAERANEARLRIGTKAEHISAPGTEMERHPDREIVELYGVIRVDVCGSGSARGRWRADLS